MVREKYLENENFSRSEKSQGILFSVKENLQYSEKAGNFYFYSRT